ncbi:MAG: redoxin domain-containing protein, partial [Planctomycetota bacterium]
MLTLCLAVTVSAADRVIDTRSFTLRDPRGVAIETSDSALNVYCFLGTQCPLAKLYGPRLQDMADRFAANEVRFVGVFSNLQDSNSDIAQYVRRHAIRFPVAVDASQQIADQFDAKRTPHVFVLDQTGAIRYQGRIDDQYAPGVARTKPTINDLSDALKQLLKGQSPARSSTPPTGCLITRRPKPGTTRDSDNAITFNQHIAPILNQHCIECHREGEIGPMALSEYQEVIGWSDMILEVIDEKRMPPWHADPAVGSFIGQRNLPKAQRDRIQQWIDQGLQEGSGVDLPPPPTFNSGWRFPTRPDVEFTMRDRPFVVPADGYVDYQYFVVDPGWKEDRWIRAAEVVPGDRAVVHHSIVFVRPPEDRLSGGIGWLAAYVPGQRPMQLPAGYARFVPAGSKLVFQMHYTPNG